MYTRRVNDAIIAILDDAVGTGVVPRLAIPQALKVVEPDWAESIDQFVKKYAATTASVYKAGEKFKHIHFDVNPPHSSPRKFWNNSTELKMEGNRTPRPW